MRGAVPGAHRVTSKKTVKKIGPAQTKKVARMTIHRAKGGYVVEHSGDEGHGPWEPPTTHVVKGRRNLQKHIAQHMDMGDEPEAEDNAAEESEE